MQNISSIFVVTLHMEIEKPKNTQIDANIWKLTRTFTNLPLLERSQPFIFSLFSLYFPVQFIGKLDKQF